MTFLVVGGVGGAYRLPRAWTTIDVLSYRSVNSLKIVSYSSTINQAVFFKNHSL